MRRCRACRALALLAAASGKGGLGSGGEFGIAVSAGAVVGFRRRVLARETGSRRGNGFAAHAFSGRVATRSRSARIAPRRPAGGLWSGRSSSWRRRPSSTTQPGRERSTGSLRHPSPSPSPRPEKHADGQCAPTTRFRRPGNARDRRRRGWEEFCPAASTAPGRRAKSRRVSPQATRRRRRKTGRRMLIRRAPTPASQSRRRSMLVFAVVVFRRQIALAHVSTMSSILLYVSFEQKVSAALPEDAAPRQWPILQLLVDRSGFERIRTPFTSGERETPRRLATAHPDARCCAIWNCIGRRICSAIGGEARTILRRDRFDHRPMVPDRDFAQFTAWKGAAADRVGCESIVTDRLGDNCFDVQDGGRRHACI